MPTGQQGPIGGPAPDEDQTELSRFDPHERRLEQQPEEEPERGQRHDEEHDQGDHLRHLPRETGRSTNKRPHAVALRTPLSGIAGRRSHGPALAARRTSVPEFTGERSVAAGNKGGSMNDTVDRWQQTAEAYAARYERVGREPVGRAHAVPGLDRARPG